MSPLWTVGLIPDFDLAVECFAWCFVQVTLFAAAVAVVYGLTRRQRAGRNVALLAAGLAVVGLLTVACVSPWPRWGFPNSVSFNESVTGTVLPAHDVLLGSKELEGAPFEMPADPRDDRLLEELVAGAHGPATAVAPANLPTLDANGSPSWYYVVLIAWLAALVGGARLIIGLVYIRRHRRQSERIDDAEMRRWFDELRKRLGVATPVELRESATLEVAATIGWRRPLILLPAAWRDWTPDQRRAVLAHELAHVAERHVPQWLVSQVATVPHFYHPLVHWLGRRLRLEQELAADALAARMFGSRRRYAAALAGLALGRLRPAGPLAALGLFMSRPLLMRRIAMLRKPTTRPRRVKRFTYLFALAVVVLAAVGVAGLRAAAPPEDESNSSPSVLDEETATALIQVTGDPIRLFNQPTGEQPWRVYSRTQAALLSSKVVLKAALERPEIAELPLVASQDNPVDWFHEQLEVGFIPDSEIMYVRMRGEPESMEQLRKIVDAVIKTYLEQFVDGDRQRRQVVRDALAKSLAKINHEIQRKMEDLHDLAKELGASEAYLQSDPERELMHRELSELARARAETERQLADLQTNFLVMQQQLKDPRMTDRMAREMVEQQLAADPNMVLLNQQLMQLQLQLAEQSSATKGERTREADRLNKQIEAVQRQIDQFRAQWNQQDAGSQQGQPNQELQAVTKEFQIRAGVLHQRIQKFEKAFAAKAEALMKKGERSVDLEIKSAAVGHLQEIARDMSIRLERMDIEADVPQDRIRVIQWAM